MLHWNEDAWDYIWQGQTALEETDMTNGKTHKMTPAEFERLVDAYGADRTRWPLNARAGAASVLASDRDARRLLAEAAALDAVLAKLPEPGAVVTGALADRIMAATRQTPRLVASTGQPSGRTVAVSAGRARFGADREMWRGVAVLAASLMIGVFAGQSQLAAGAVPALEALTGVSLASSPDRLAALDMHLDSMDED